jgi:hypothetical protein
LARQPTLRAGRTSAEPPEWSGVFQESEVEGREYQDDSDIRHQSWQELMSEEEQINSHNRGGQQQPVR